MFSDGSRFSLQSDSRGLVIWREPGLRYNPTFIHLHQIREVTLQCSIMIKGYIRHQRYRSRLLRKVNGAHIVVSLA